MRTHPLSIRAIAPFIGASLAATSCNLSPSLEGEAELEEDSEEETAESAPSEGEPHYERADERCDGLPGRVIDIDSHGHTCAVFEGGQLKCWGPNAFGALGYGSTEIIGDDETPSEIGFVDVGGCVDHVDVSSSTTCVVLRGGAVKCWGYNQHGQLGLGHTETISDEEPPSHIPAIRFSAPATRVETGSFSACALLEDGAIYCWGSNDCGRLGYGNALRALGDDEPIYQGEPVRQKSRATDVAVSDRMNCLLDEERHLTCWGSHSDDTGHPPEESWYYQVFDPEFPYGCDSVPAKAQGHYISNPVLDLALGDEHACALDVEHELRCWGTPWVAAALGYGQDMDAIFPDVPALHTEGTVVAIDAGDSTTCALYDDGRARCWGDNWTGALGQGNIEQLGDDEIPSDIPFIDIGEPIEKISAGSDFTCVLTVSGQVRCWGSNDQGQLGLGHTNNIGDDELPSSVPPVSLL